MSMTGQRPAVGRGGFTRSAGAAAGRGVLLIVFALAIGILLLARAIDGDDGGTAQSAATSSTAATATTVDPATQTTPVATTPTTAALPPAHDPSQVPVLVLNGREIQGVARVNNEVLLRLGYNGLPPDNTAAAVAVTNVFYTDPAFQADAIKVAEALQIPADKVVELGATNLGIDLKTSKVVVVLGQDGLGVPS